MATITVSKQIDVDAFKEYSIHVEPCPFCGSENIEIDEAGIAYVVFCVACEAQGPVASEIKDAVEKWNERG